MTRMSLKVDGLRELDRALSELPKATQGNVLKRTLLRGAEPVEAAAKSKVKKFTGALERDIETSTKLTRRQAAAARRAGKSQAEVHIGVVDPAGVQTEFGNARQAADPWFRPAWDESQGEALNEIAGGLGEEIEKARGRLARKAARLAAKNGG